MKNNNLLVTGALGFIGAHFVHYYRAKHPSAKLIILDKNTYAADYGRLKGFIDTDKIVYVEGDISNEETVRKVFDSFRPMRVVNFAAESHVDNSIEGPGIFLETNVNGTFILLEAARKLWMAAPHQVKAEYEEARFYQISTDEVFGSLGDQGKFSESSNYAPNSPYSASKASADHWVRSYFHTFGLPTLLTQCSNNFGPHQHSEKLIPTVIRTALKGESVPIYGTGKNIRDWLYVEDHCSAIELVLNKATPGETYTIGGNAERNNLSICETILTQLDILNPKPDGKSYKEQISFVADRPGHDFRYAIDASKIANELGWTPQHSFEEGLEKTVSFYLKKYKEGS
jgi:dTDP-glucose 4,6-dehydratase